MTTEIRWGVVGPGRIAEKVVEDFAVVDGARAVAVASRSQARADDFATRHGLDRAYGSYAEIMRAEDVDALYIATPHSQHYKLALDERVQLLVGGIADQVRPPPAPPRPHGAVDQQGHGWQSARSS